LLGKDTEFEPKEPWGKSNTDVVQNLQRRWEEASGLPYGVTNRGLYHNRRRMPKELAKYENEYWWVYDERGSYNAVCGFLRSLGARWYAPGPLGEILPQLDSIPLPEIDETVKPDFEIRQFYVRIGGTDEEVTRWVMRLGLRHEYGLMVAHGMDHMTRPDKIKTDHPDWFALYGGKRDINTRQKLNHLCYSNEELFRETVKWARAQFDVYDFPAVSIMPPDAYGSICQCELCEGKEVEEMGSRGKLSNHVWDFANRVAKEVGKTHPDKLITCCAYGANTQPPTNIDKLEPNVQVLIVGGRRPRNTLPDQREAVRKLREGWLRKTDRPIIVFENYPFTGRGVYLPVFVARTIGESINATKGVSRGEDIWTTAPRYHDSPNVAFDHFQKPIYGTTVMSGWHRGNLYFAIRCEERPGEKLNIATTKREDQSLWYGDCVEIELATEAHSYYQIAVNPAGALVDLDRATGRQFDWSSQAEVATQIADDYWTIEIRIPVSEDENDPLNFVIGRKPSQSLPWFFNVCRQRIRENGAEYSAISPTGEMSFHKPLKFGYFYHGRHHVFAVDETVTDFLIEYRAAAKLKSSGKIADAQAAFAALADHEQANDYQISRALAEAAACARHLKDYPATADFANRIPDQAIAATTRMENLAAEGKWGSIIEEFGTKDLSSWPFTRIGSAALVRGRAYYAEKSGDKAEADFQLALVNTTDSLARMAVLNARARNFETVLNDEVRALQIYRVITSSDTYTNHYEFFTAIQGASRILTRQQKFDEAIAIHHLADKENLRGSWFGTMMTARAETLAAAGRKAEALEVYRAVLNHDSSHAAHKRGAKEAIAELE